MRQYTTPTLDLFVKGVDLRGYDVTVTIRQKGTVVNVEEPTIEFIGENTTLPGSMVTVELTQSQTGAFSVGTAEIQVNWIDLLGKRNATKIKTVAIHENLIAQVM
jgi:hypothetical protein